MEMESGLDTGPVIGQAPIDISPEDTTESLTRRLADLSASIVADDIWEFTRGERKPTPQPIEGATLTRPLVKADGWLDWNQSADILERWVRAMWPWPRAWTTLNDEIVQFHSSHMIATVNSGEPGTLIVEKQRVAVATSIGLLAIDKVQFPGGKPIEGVALVERFKKFDGARLGTGAHQETMSPFVARV